MEQETVATTPTQQMVVFGIHNELFATDIGIIREVIKLQTITPVPGAPAVIAGIINIRGRIVPLLELGALLHIGSHTATEAFVLLTDTPDNGLVGMIVDKVLTIKRFESDSIQAAPKVLESKVSPDFIAGVILPKEPAGNEGVLVRLDLMATISKTVAEVLNGIKDTAPNTEDLKENQ